MNLREFAKEVAGIIPTIHIELAKRQPDVFLKEKITFPQMVIISLLSGRNNCKMGDIAKILDVTKGAVTGLTDRLIKSGIIKRVRSKSDRRVVYVMLTSKGIRYAKRLNDFKLKIVSGLFSNISQKERAEYLKILRKLKKNIEAKLEYKYYG